MFDGFQFPKTMIVWMDDHSGAAGWAQAFIAGLAIVAVYYAATIPIRAENKRREDERLSKADSLKLLLVPEVLVLQGELESAVESGQVTDPPVCVSETLMDRADQMYLMGETGRRLVQAMGMVNGVAAQTRRFIAICDAKGVARNARSEVGRQLWANNVATYRLSLINLGEIMKDFNPQA